MAGRIVFDHVWKRFHRGPAHDSLRDLIPALARRAVGVTPIIGTEAYMANVAKQQEGSTVFVVGSAAACYGLADLR